MASNLEIRVKEPAELTAAELDAWAAIRAQNPALYSPYFDPYYTLLIGEIRKDAKVAIAYEKQTAVCFFPFQGSGFVRPLGAPMTDYQGFIEAAGAKIDHAEFLHKAGIGALHYSTLVGEQSDMVGFHREEYPLCLIDLSEGVEAWRTSRSSSYRRSLKSNRRRIRRTEDDYERRFEYKSRCGVAYDQLMAWKRERFVETGLYDVLSADWTSGLLRELWERDEGLRCDMHVLYFGDDMAAMDMGLTDGETFHSWMVAYNPDFHALSPGTQLLEDMIDKAPELGYRYIDLGTGVDSYKSAYALEDGPVARSGFVPVAGAAAAISKLYGAAEKFGEKSLKDIPGKLRRRYTQIADCDETVSGRAKAMFEAVRSGGSR